MNQKKNKNNIKKQPTDRLPSRAATKRSGYYYPIEVNADEIQRFDYAVSEWNGLALAAVSAGEATIGILGEKSLHSILKRYVTANEAYYEVPIHAKDPNRTRRYVADICDGERIVEIQTGGFYPLIPKLAYYLNETDYDVTVLHPIPGNRCRVWISPESGEIVERKPVRSVGRAEDALRELFWIRDYLHHPRLHIKLIFLKEDEYRYLDGWGRDKKRGSNRCERVPAALLGSVTLYGPQDYTPFLKPELPDTFTATELGQCFGFRGKTIYSALKVFLAVGLVREIGKQGRSVLYARSDRKEADLFSEYEASELNE